MSLNGRVEPGDVVAVVGAGPIGLAAILGARLFSPSHIVAIDLAGSRLDAAKQFGTDITINNGVEDAKARIAELTDGLGADVAIEAVGVPATFGLVTPVTHSSHHLSTRIDRRIPGPELWRRSPLQLWLLCVAGAPIDLRRQRLIHEATTLGAPEQLGPGRQPSRAK